MKVPIPRLRALAAELYHLPERVLHPARRAAASRALREIGSVRSVLVVCHGNICRSPYAAAVLRRELAGRPIDTGSGGFFGPGRPAPAEAMAAARARGIDLTAHISALVSRDAVRVADVLVVMDGRQRDALIRSFGAYPRRTILLGDLDPQPVRRRAVRDPVDQPVAVFDAVYQRIDRCVRGLVDALPGMEGTVPGPRGGPTERQRPVAQSSARRALRDD